jgi:membrane associated rhomboid family serine protease
VIPLRDTITARRFPFVNYTLIGLCGLGFWIELTAGAGAVELIEEHALVPARFLALGGRSGFAHPDLYAPFVTSLFLHAGWLHFLGNMLFLWIFGDNVEDRMGHAGYALFYLAGGVLAGAAHLAANPTSVAPTLGASGAIGAVMGAYLVLFPSSRIVSLLILGFYVRTIAVPAVLYLAFWFGFELLRGTLALGHAPGEGGVAYWAHIGGFAFGMAAVALLGLRSPPSRTRSSARG